MKKLLFLLLFTLTCCATPVSTNNCPETHKPRFTKFKVGDCIKIKPEVLKPGQYTESIPFKVIEVNTITYTTLLYYTNLGYTMFNMPIKNVDKDFDITECTIELEHHPVIDSIKGQNGL